MIREFISSQGLYLPNHFAQTGCNTRSISKWSLTGVMKTRHFRLLSLVVMECEWVPVRILRVLLLGFIRTTNTTQILQAHKQMEYNNNEHLETNNLIIITNRIKIIRNTMFMLCTSGLCRKYSYGRLNENRIVRPCVFTC